MIRRNKLSVCILTPTIAGYYYTCLCIPVLVSCVIHMYAYATKTSNYMQGCFIFLFFTETDSIHKNDAITNKALMALIIYYYYYSVGHILSRAAPFFYSQAVFE